MKNYKKIKGAINKFYKAKIKEYRTSARVWVGRENIENPTKEQRAKAINELKKALSRDLAHLEKVAAAPVLRSVSVVTEWVNNRTWGHNPHAFATIETAAGCERTEGRASGCGYDKYSAAVTSALCNNLSVQRAICEHLNELKKDERYPHSCYVYDVCGMPRLCTSGSGISSLRGVFGCLGFKCEENRESKRTDFLKFYK